MKNTEKILSYLKETYRPSAVILYGSYADGTNRPDSDFDALLIAQAAAPLHDTSIVDGVRLDVFVRSEDAIGEKADPEDYLQIEDGVILADEHGAARALRERVRSYVAAAPKKTPEEIAEAIAWCEKMLLRAARDDAEGRYRKALLLTESLRVFFDKIGEPFRGPKKALALLKNERPEACLLYTDALSGQNEALGKWISFLRGDRASVHGSAARDKTERVELTVLCLIEREGEILLQNRRKRDWQGYALPGGHVEAGESIVSAVIREMREETGLTVRPRLVGVKQFPIAGGRYLVFLFRAVSYSGEVCSSDEGEMRWIPRDRLADFATVDDLAELISVFDSPELTEFRYVERDGGFAVELS